MSITLEQAKAILEDKNSRPKTLDELRNLINSLDVTGSGNVTVLYSGGFGNNTSAEGIALALANSNSDIRIVNKTDAAKFLDYKSNSLILELFDTFWVEDDADPEKQEIKDKDGRIIQEASSANKFLYDVNYGGGLGAWATVSKNFVSSPATHGNVRVIAPFADPSRVFAEIEFSELMKNDSVNSIDGHSKAQIERLGLDASHAGKAAKAVQLTAIINNSGIEISRLQIPTDKFGVIQSIDKVPVAIGTNNYFNDGTIVGQPIPDGMHASSATNVIITARADERISLPKNVDPDVHLENSKFANEQLKTYANEQKAAAVAAGDAVALAKAEKLLNKLGIAGDAIALGFAINEANAAYEAGDTNKAIDTMTRWGLEFSGGVAGGVAAAALVSSALAPMYLMGPFGIVVAGGLSLLAGIAGGVLGGDAFVNVFGSMLGLDDEAPEIPKPKPPKLPPLPPRDPLALDLNGDSVVNTLPMSRGVHFDLDNSGFAEQTSWVAPEDGLLVLDRNNNNFIDGGAELFGTETLLSNGEYAKHGFEALAEFDVNQDGAVDANDAVYSSLRVWRDTNSNGIADSGELKTLGELDIKSIATAYTNIDILDANNVGHREAGAFTYNNSTQSITNTLWFESDRRITVPVTELQGNAPISDAIKMLPNAIGFGNTYSLHQAMAIDVISDLQKKVQRFSVELNPEKRRELLREILVLWTGTGGVVAGSRGNEVDATSLSIMESFWGQLALQDKPIGAYASSVNEAYIHLEQSVYSQLMASTHMRDLLSLTDFTEVNGVWTADYSVVVGLFANDFLVGNEFAALAIVEYVVTIRGLDVYSDSLYNSLITEIDTAANLLPAQERSEMLAAAHSHGEIIVGSSIADLLEGFGGDDQLNGGSGDDVLDGGDGDDRIYGDAGDDIIRGGTGMDYLQGGIGNNTYHYKLGDGGEFINDTKGVNSIVFGENINSRDIDIVHSAGDLIINVSDGGYIIVNNFSDYDGRIGDGAIDRISFIDNEEWDIGEIILRSLKGSELNDQLYGYSLNDTIDASDGDDVIYGLSGNDNLTGGKGIDTIHGGDGDDSYLYQLGDGNDEITDTSGIDEIVLGEGISPDEITLARQDWHGLKIVLKDGGTILINKMFNYSDDAGINAIEGIRFFNDDVWNLAQIKAKIIQDSITEGNDIVEGFASNDVIEGGGGFDQLRGKGGDDRYIFNPGDGVDIITETAGNDKIVFGAGINPDDIRVIRDGNVKFTIQYSENDRVHITSYLNSLYTVETIQFENGDVWNFDQIIKAALTGSDGNDRILAYGSDDVLNGKQGRDSLEGWSGNDTYLFNQGDGVDTILDIGGMDKIKFGENIQSADLMIAQRDGNTLLLFRNGDQITISGDVADANKRIESIEFASGEVWGTAEIGQRISETAARSDVFIGSSAWNRLIGADNQDDYLNGLLGTDDLRGGSGNDVLVSAVEAKVNILDGGAGSDTFIIFPSNNGSSTEDLIVRGFRDAGDRIVFDSSIKPDDIEVRIEELDGYGTYINGNGRAQYYGSDYDHEWSLVLKTGGAASERIVVHIEHIFANTGSKTHVLGTQLAAPTTSVGTVTFADGTVWDYDTLITKAQIGSNNHDRLSGLRSDDRLQGFDGNDTLYGYAGNDVIEGGKGGDLLQGGDGDDGYYFSLDDGHDVIYDANGANHIVFASGIDWQNVVASRPVMYGVRGSDLVISIGNEQSITVNNFFVADSDRINPQRLIEQFSFNDGSAYSAVQFLTRFADFVIDLTPPVTPSATLNSAGTEISGNAEPGSIISLSSNRFPLGLSTIADATTGAYTLLTAPYTFVNGQTLGVKAIDQAGNASAEFIIHAPDVTAPYFNSGGFYPDGDIICGSTNEYGITVIASDSNGVELGRGSSSLDPAENGRFYIALSTPLINSEVLTLTSIDLAGNVSLPYLITAPDKVAPSAPTASFNFTGKVITGVAEAGSTVIVKNAAGEELKAATANAITGAYTITLTTALINKETVNITATDAAGNVSVARTAVAPDPTAVIIQAENYSSMSGVWNESTNDVGGGKSTGNINTGDWMAYNNIAFNVPIEGRYKITYRVASLNGGGRLALRELSNESTLGSIAIPKTGAWQNWVDVTHEIMLTGGVHNFKLYAENGGFNVNWFMLEPLTPVASDTTPPAQPSAAFDPQGLIITGVAEAGSVVVVKHANNTLGTITADATTGAYSITLGTALINKETVNITATDAAGNISIALSLAAPEVAISPAESLVIQAENYSAMSGVWNEATSDIGGGQNTGNIHTGDWMAYNNANFNVPAEGLYKITYRVASLNGGGRLVLKDLGTNATLSEVNIPKTGAWQSWIDVTQEVSFSEGVYNFKLQGEIGGFNVNWFKLEPLEATASVITPLAKFSAMLGWQDKVITKIAEADNVVVVNDANTGSLGRVIADAIKGVYEPEVAVAEVGRLKTDYESVHYVSSNDVLIQAMASFVSGSGVDTRYRSTPVEQNQLVIAVGS